MPSVSPSQDICHHARYAQLAVNNAPASTSTHTHPSSPMVRIVAPATATRQAFAQMLPASREDTAQQPKSHVPRDEGVDGANLAPHDA
jgi:hypothetical protein